MNEGKLVFLSKKRGITHSFKMKLIYSRSIHLSPSRKETGILIKGGIEILICHTCRWISPGDVQISSQIKGKVDVSSIEVWEWGLESTNQHHKSRLLINCNVWQFASQLHWKTSRNLTKNWKRIRLREGHGWDSQVSLMMLKKR